MSTGSWWIESLLLSNKISLEWREMLRNHVHVPGVGLPNNVHILLGIESLLLANKVRHSWMKRNVLQSCTHTSSWTKVGLFQRLHLGGRRHVFISNSGRGKYLISLTAGVRHIPQAAPEKALKLTYQTMSKVSWLFIKHSSLLDILV